VLALSPSVKQVDAGALRFRFDNENGALKYDARDLLRRALALGRGLRLEKAELTAARAEDRASLSLIVSPDRREGPLLVKLRRLVSCMLLGSTYQSGTGACVCLAGWCGGRGGLHDVRAPSFTSTALSLGRSYDVNLWGDCGCAWSLRTAHSV
jgi:hypothetical protein